MSDHLRHLDPIDIAPARLARWRECAGCLGEAGTALRAELVDLIHDPTRHRIERAAHAARQAERQCTGDEALIANAVATELEDLAVVFPITSRAEAAARTLGAPEMPAGSSKP